MIITIEVTKMTHFFYGHFKVSFHYREKGMDYIINTYVNNNCLGFFFKN